MKYTINKETKMDRTFKPSHLTRDERAVMTSIENGLEYFRCFAGKTPASREWANARYWELQNEKSRIQIEAHDRCRRTAIEEACTILSEIAWKGGFGCYDEQVNYEGMLKDFEKAAALLRPWGFVERGTTFVNLDRQTAIRTEYSPTEIDLN
jgi:hypothetical protein